jgi:hypothetical protein
LKLKHSFFSERDEKEKRVDKWLSKSGWKELMMGDEKKQNGIKVLEKGYIYFFYRPRVDETKVTDLNDVERLYMVLETLPQDKGSQDQQHYRLIVIGQKQLPEIHPGGGGQAYWGFVEKVSHQAEEITQELSGKTYQTKTEGQQTKEPARPIGEGVYDLVEHGDHTDLAYELKLPTQPGEVQKAFRLREQGCYIFSIKNPEQPAQGGINFQGEAAHYPKRLQEIFHGRKWAPVEPPDFLNHQGTQILLVGAEPNVMKDLGINLQPQLEKEAQDAIFQELHLQQSQHPSQGLFKGQW